MQTQLADARRDGQLQDRARARSLAVFYGSGGLLSVASCLVPGWHPEHRAGLLALAGVALATSVALLILGSRVSGRLCQIMLALGSGLIAACMLLAGPSPMAVAYAFFFCWVSVFAANWFTVRGLAVHLCVIAVCQAGAFHVVGLDGFAVPASIVSLGACAAAGIVVHQLRTQLREQAIRDPLTGALNRRGLAQVLQAAPQQKLTRTIVALDLDGFKAYNDTQGHAQGDHALRDCVAAWTALLDPAEVCARLGGDEFVLVCHRPPEAITALVARARECVPPDLAVSVGVATAVAGEPIADLFERADVALYRDKEQPASPRRRRGAPTATPARRTPIQVRPT